MLQYLKGGLIVHLKWQWFVKVIRWCKSKTFCLQILAQILSGYVYSESRT